MHTNVERKKVHTTKDGPNIATRQGTPFSNHIPNSAMGAMMGVGPSSSSSVDELGARILQRLPAVQQRSQAQIPRAENEADRLSAAINAGTPESVKAMMGQRMGADFSGVRFHTGAAAAAKADTMGARAYTSGADIYFGSGGFDPSVAAHELVHTAQQGMVDSGMAVMSTPVGGVQMMPNPLKWLWNKTGGRAIRKHHDAMDELHQAMKTSPTSSASDWDSLTPEQQNSWIRHNLIAYNRYMKNKDDGNFTKKLDDRAKKREDEQTAAQSYLEANKAALGKHSSMLTAPTPAATSAAGSALAAGTSPVVPTAANLVIGSKKADEGGFGRIRPSAGDAVETGSTVADDFVKTPLDIVQSVMETAGATEKSSSGVGAAGGALGILSGAVGAVSAIGDLREAVGSGHKMGVVDNAVDLAGNTAKVGSGAAAIGKAALKAGSGAAEAAKEAVAGFDIVSGAADMYLGGREIYKGEKKREAMRAFQEKHYHGKSRKDLEGEGLLFRDMSDLGRMEGKRQITEGVGKTITGTMDVAAGGLELGGVTAGAGLGVKAASAATKAGFAVADSRQRHRMKKSVVEQTTGLTNEHIRRFQTDNNIKSFSRAKQALMKGVGYSSGQREELFADQTAKRGKVLAERANDSTAGSHSVALELAEGLGTRKRDGNFDAGRLAEAMGKRKSRGEIISRRHRIRHMMNKNRAAAGGTP